jgi:hypothetical protein
MLKKILFAEKYNLIYKAVKCKVQLEKKENEELKNKIKQLIGLE